jgi:molybdate transport system regulatory protein
MRVRLNVWVENELGELLFGEGRQQILEAIQTHGSLSAAAESLGMSYRGLWARVRNSEKRLGFPLIESHAGRGPESGTALTPEGRALLKRFTRLQKQVLKSTQTAFQRLFPEAF